jgi:hypothetical protein
MPGALLITIVSWLASHLIVLTLLAFAVVGVILYQDDGMTASTVAVSPSAVAVERESAGRSDPQAAVKPAEKEAAQPEPASKPKPKKAKQPKLIGGSLPVYPDMPGQATTDSFASTDGFRPPEPHLAPSSEPSTYAARIQQARRAYWNGEFELAETRYVDLVTIYPDDADAFGELGNLYETMGEWQLAKDAYFAAGERLKRAGEAEKLNHVIDLLEKKGDSRAQRLRRH